MEVILGPKAPKQGQKVSFGDFFLLSKMGPPNEIGPYGPHFLWV